MQRLLAISLAVVLMGGGCTGLWFDRPLSEPPGPKTREAVYFLTALADSPAYEQANTITGFGCGDRLMLQRDSVPRSDEPALVTNLNRMFALPKSDAEARGLFTPFEQDVHAELSEEKGKPVVNIVGTLTSGGSCDDPRIHKMVQETARLTLGVMPEIRLNGSERDWRCMGDQSGQCQ